MNKKKKNKAGKVLAWIVIILVVALLAALPMLAPEKVNDSGITASVVSAQAELRGIDTVLVGGGQLSSSGVFDLQIPENIKITEFLVGNGDTVREGDAIALVDSVSVLSAIAQVEDTLKELASRINSADGSGTSSSISSKPAGRVKAIYAEAGDDAADVMLEYGALAVISLDDIMAVKLETISTLTAGDKVTVCIGDETVAGRVKANIGGELTVTLTDNSYAIGQEAAVYAENGNVLGRGTLYVYNAWNAVAYSGTVTGVSIRENQSIYAGQTLFNITESGKSAEYQKAIDKRRKYEALEAELFELRSTGVLTAPCDGIISGIDSDGAFMLSDSEGSDGIRLLFLSDIIYLSSALPDATMGTAYIGQLTAWDGENNPLNGTWAGSGLPGGLSLGSDGSVTGTPTVSGSFAFPVAFTPEGTEDAVSGTVSITVLSESADTYYCYIARVTDGSSEGGAVRAAVGPDVSVVSDPSRLPKENPDVKTLTESATYTGAAVASAKLVQGDCFWAVFRESNSSNQPDSIIRIHSEGGSGNTPGGTTPGGSGGTIPGGSGGSFPSGTGGFSGAGGNAEADDGLYSLGRVTVAAITSQEQMTVSITVDELDITKIHVGQTASITMNAIAGESAEAVVKGISNEGKNSGGNSKFTVEFSLNKSSQMLPGMNATAVITLSTEENILCVPAAAVYEQDGKTFVYTGCNEQTKQPENPVEVTVGCADADYVEILSGISSGTEVYYETYRAANPGFLL